eukprot:1024836-Prymnesium_polylepis.2
MPSHLRLSSKGLRALWEALNDLAGRFVPSMDLENITAVSEVRHAQDNDLEEVKNGPEKKDDDGTWRGRRRRIMLLMRGLAAVGGRAVAADLSHTSGQGTCLLGVR